MPFIFNIQSDMKTFFPFTLVFCVVFCHLVGKAACCIRLAKTEFNNILLPDEWEYQGSFSKFPWATGFISYKGPCYWYWAVFMFLSGQYYWKLYELEWKKCIGWEFNTMGHNFLGKRKPFGKLTSTLTTLHSLFIV